MHDQVVPSVARQDHDIDARPRPSSYVTHMQGCAPAVVVVDPYSTGASVADEVASRGVHSVLALWSRAHRGQPQAQAPFCAAVDEQPNAALTAMAIQRALPSDTPVSAIICGAEDGVILAEDVSEHLGLPSNRTPRLRNRRHKQSQQEALCRAGLRAARSVSGVLWSDVQLLVDMLEMPVVVKPAASTGCASYTRSYTVAPLQLRSLFASHGSLP